MNTVMVPPHPKVEPRPGPVQEFLRSHWEFVALAAILLLGLALRLYRLDWLSGTPDEAFSLILSRQSFGEITQGAIRDYVNPPLYYYLLHMWLYVGGNSIAAARLLSVACGALTVFILFRLVRMLCGARPALLAALLLAISQTGVAYSQEARTYSLTLLLATCTAWLFVNVPQSLAYWWAFVACGLTMIYTHYYSVFVLMALFILSRIYPNRFQVSLGSWLSAAFVWGAASLPWISSGIVKQYRGNPKLYDGGINSGSHWYSAVTTLNTFNNGRWDGIYSAAPIWTYPIGALLMVAPVMWYVITEFRKPTTEGSSKVSVAAFFLVLLSVPLVAVLALAGFAHIQYGHRYVLVVLAPYYALIAVAISNIASRWLRNLLVVGITAFSIGALWAYFFLPSKTEFRPASEYLRSRVQPDDCVGFAPAPRSVRIPRYWSIYGSALADSRMFPIRGPISIAPECRRLWVAWSPTGNSRRQRQTLEQATQQFESDFVLSESKSFYGIKLELWSRKSTLDGLVAP